MVTTRYTHQFTTTASTAFQVWSKSEHRRAAQIVVVTDGSVAYIGNDSTLTAATGHLVPIQTPLNFGKSNLDPTAELWMIETAGSKVITVYEEFTHDEYSITGKD
jgi:mannose-6-phosphate isomerase class I